MCSGWSILWLPYKAGGCHIRQVRAHGGAARVECAAGPQQARAAESRGRDAISAGEIVGDLLGDHGVEAVRAHVGHHTCQIRKVPNEACGVGTWRRVAFLIRQVRAFQIGGLPN